MSSLLPMFGFFFLFIIIFLLIVFWSNRKKVEKNHMCILVTKSNDLIIEMWPKAAGEIEAPPHKEFKNNDKQSRTYFYKRPFSLKAKYPTFARFPMNLVQVDASASIYEEGDPWPILPSNEETASTPERVNIMAGQKIAGQVINRLSDSLAGQQGVGGLNLGKNKMLVQIVIVVFGIAILVAAYGGFMAIQFIPFAQQWMSLR